MINWTQRQLDLYASYYARLIDYLKNYGNLGGTGSYTHPATHPATMIVEDTENNFVTTTEKGNIHASGSDNQDLSGKVDTTDSRLSDARNPLTHSHAASDITGTAVVTSDARLSDSRPASDVSTWAKAANKPSYNASEVGAEAANANIQTHVTVTPHAPAGAQANADGGVITGILEARDHGTADVDEVVNICYGTSDTPPTASTTTIGTLYVKYTP